MMHSNGCSKKDNHSNYFRNVKQEHDVLAKTFIQRYLTVVHWTEEFSVLLQIDIGLWGESNAVLVKLQT